MSGDGVDAAHSGAAIKLRVNKAFDMLNEYMRILFKIYIRQSDVVRRCLVHGKADIAHT
jgi:hypothetical protein